MTFIETRIYFAVVADDGTKIWKPKQENGVPQAQLKDGNMLVTEVYPLSNLNEWIFMFNEHPNMKMIKLKITGPFTFDWISCKLDANVACASKFSESCYKGTDCTTTVTLTAEGIL